MARQLVRPVHNGLRLVDGRVEKFQRMNGQFTISFINQIGTASSGFSLVPQLIERTDEAPGEAVGPMSRRIIGRERSRDAAVPPDRSTGRCAWGPAA